MRTHVLIALIEEESEKIDPEMWASAPQKPVRRKCRPLFSG